MARLATRASVSCASCLNWAALVLLIFASASGYWSWGYTLPLQGSPTNYAVSFSTGPWVASQLWSNVAIPCDCGPGCTWCYVGASSWVMWGGIPASAACGPTSDVYLGWSGPLGYCSFAEGTQPPTPPPTPVTVPRHRPVYGGAPPGSEFNNPSSAVTTQALIIISTIAAFFAAIAGSVDASLPHGSRSAGAAAALCALICWVFGLAAICVWATFQYVQSIQAATPTVQIPVWVNKAANQMTAIPVSNVWFGAGWSTALTATIIVFLTSLVHCASLGTRSESSKGPTSTRSNQPAQPVNIVQGANTNPTNAALERA